MHLSRHLWTGLSLFAALLAAVPAAQPAGWWQWRGPFNTGMAVGSAPLRWSDDAGVRWKTAIPGRGHSTPVVAGHRLFLTTAVPTGRGSAPAGRSRGGGGGGADAGLEHRFDVIAIDRATGAVAWQRTATVATPHEGYHGTYGSFASNSPVTDGQRVFAFFGSRGLFAYSLDGELLWQKDFGIKLRMDGAFGEGTAPMLHDGRLFVLFDHLDRGFLAVLDAASGRELFRIPRPERYNWAAPFIATHDGRRQIVVNGETTRGYDYDSGTELWRAGGLGENSVPQAVQHGDRVFVMSGHTIKMLMAIRLGGRGDLTGTDAITWSTPRGVSYTPSPLLHDSKLYIVGDAGLVSCLDAETGRPFWGPERLPRSSTFKASPVGAAGRIYLATEEGDVVVLRLGDKFEVLATNTLKDQSFIASPIVLDGSIYLRSRTHLFRVDEPTAAGDAMQPEATQAPNTLSPTEKSAGWRLLFDGATSAGWHLFGESELARHSAQRDGRVVGWEVADGALVALAQDGGHDIVTDDEFENVELVLDWKLSPRANSGVFFNVVEQGYKVIYATGPEYQIIDDDGWPSRLEDWQRTGANYAMHPPLARATKPVGEWNQTRIVVNRGHVEHWLNGAKTADYVLWTPEWEKLVSAGKWKDYPGYGRAKKGRIGLQDHGNKVWFRNIKVRAIPPRG